MDFLDLRTVFISLAVTGLVSLLVIFSLFLQYRGRFAGIGLWLVHFLLQFAALVLFALRGAFPAAAGLQTLAVALGSPLLILGVSLLCRGLERFVDNLRPRWPYFVFPPAYVLAHLFFTFASPRFGVREILYACALLAVCLRCVWLLRRGTNRVLKPMTSGLEYVFLAYSLVSAASIVLEVVLPKGNDLFDAGAPLGLGLLVSQALSIALTFSLLLMVNRRLFAVYESDLAGRDQAERIVRLRLKLWEYAVSHTVSELMQKALDEIELLTGSVIGFYHFVEEDRETLSLQAWSTRTRAEYCRAEGEGMHYAIKDAGVWVDCVRERGPVIHNDYVSLPHRKGLPAGHAPLIRELVVPTLRQDRVVAILGVGNKPTEYDNNDVFLVSYIADLVWSIVTQRRADETIRSLNEKLEHLAMTDDLTGLPNRRAFFLRAQEEIGRSLRYRGPLSCVMADIDHFKQINDAYGHDAGDEALKEMARVLLATVRNADLVARLGGEEFGILLPRTEMEDALVLAERLRVAVERDVAGGRRGDARVTASFGVASLREGVGDIDTLLHNADVAMYQAKLLGRNRVARFD